jgi:hypothetical protein
MRIAFATEEADANYAVFVEQNWIGNRAVVKKEAKGFTVQFEKPDGTLFVRGPCCGATEQEMPSQSDFVFTVVRQGEGFAVQELPVYVP